MPIIAKAPVSTFEDDFAPAPPGVAVAVCCDVIDLGIIETNYSGEIKKQHKIKIVWQLAETDESLGQRPIASKRYTNSLHEKSTLRKDLESWRGRQFTFDELQGFDVEKVIGAAAMISITHGHGTKNPAKIYANVVAVMALPKGMARPAVEGYTRLKDRQTPAVAPTPKPAPKYAPTLTTDAELGTDDRDADDSF